MKFKENVQNCNENIRKYERKHCGKKGMQLEKKVNNLNKTIKGTKLDLKSTKLE